MVTGCFVREKKYAYVNSFDQKLVTLLVVSEHRGGQKVAFLRFFTVT